MKSKAVKTPPRSHKVMAGDHYGSGKKAKVGRMREGSVGYIPVTKKQLRKPPKAVG
jgi:hypothetical protein